MTPIDTGYEGDKDPFDTGTPAEYVLERFERQFVNHGVFARLLRNDEPVGMVRCMDEAEFEWLCKRIKGTYDPEGDET